LPRQRTPGVEKHEADAVSAKVSLADCARIAALLWSAFLASGTLVLAGLSTKSSNYYVGAYFEGAFVGDHSTMAVPVQWLYKTAPGKKRELAMVADVVSDSADNGVHLPMKLSPRGQLT
jgi:hypothetical protein